MWKLLLVIILFNDFIGIENKDQLLGDNWKRGSVENPDDSDFVKTNETHLEDIPAFIKQPEKVYHVYENKPARIICIAEPVSHVNVICNKITYPYMDKEVSESNLRVKKMNKQNQLDPHGDRWMFSLDVTYNQVTEWFNTYSCVCEAWNQVPVLRQAKKIHSNYGVFKEAYFKKIFRKAPQSTIIQKGQRLILSCVPPDSKPKSTVHWLKDGERLYDNGRVKIVDEFQLSIDDSVLSDSGNYSCIASSLDERRYSPLATVKIQEGVWGDWSQWSKCDSSCRRIRRRTCHGTSGCVGNLEQIEACLGDCENNKAVAPYVKSHDKSGGATGGLYDPKDIAMYVGLFIAVSILVMVITVVFCLIRRRTMSPLRSSRYPIDINGNGISYDVKNNLIKNSNAISIKNQNAMLIQQRSFLSQSPPNLPPPTCLSEISSNNAYSTGIDVSYNSTGSGNFSQPLISNSSSASTTNKSKVTAASNQDSRDDGMDRSDTPVNSRPSSALYHELSLDRESLSNPPPFVSENIDLSSLAWATISSAGGRLCLPQSGVSLTIMNNSFFNTSGQEMYLAVSRSDPDPPLISDKETFLSPIVLFGPSNVEILKPCVLSIPHSADMRPGHWIIKLMSYATPQPPDHHDGNTIASGWKTLAIIGRETDSTPIYSQIDSYSVHFLTNKCQKLCLIGESYPGVKATKRLRLAAFGRPLSLNPYVTNYNIRIYAFPDTKEAFENVSTLELKLGSTLLDSTHQILFSDGMGSLFFGIEELSPGWRSQLSTKYQEIPFLDVWGDGPSGTLHCAFTFDCIDPDQQSIICVITAYQSGVYHQKQTVVIKQDKLDRINNKRDLIQLEKVILHSETNNTYLDPLMTLFRISATAKRRLCILLDNLAPRSNDWRQLVKQLKLSGYTNYFLNQVSPTETVLTLWESRNRSETALNDLINHFKAIGRLDCANILEVEYSSYLAITDT